MLAVSTTQCELNFPSPLNSGGATFDFLLTVEDPDQYIFGPPNQHPDPLVTSTNPALDLLSSSKSSKKNLVPDPYVFGTPGPGSATESAVIKVESLTTASTIYIHKCAST